MLRLLLGAFLSTALAVQPLPADSNADGVSDGAPALRYYAGVDGEAALGPDSDPHAVHGIALSGGGFALTGKYSVGGGRTGGFLFVMPTPPQDDGYLGGGVHRLLTESNQAVTWMATFANTGPGNGGGNQLAEVGGNLYVVAYSSGDALVCKYQVANGQAVWEAKVDIDGSSVSALESITPTTDGGIVVGGLTNSEAGCLEGFKSYGNPGCGTAALAHFTRSQIESSAAPQQPTWTSVFTGFISVKTVKEVPSSHGHGFALATSMQDPEGVAAVIRTDSTGSPLWQQSYPEHGEVTDLVVLGASHDLQFLISGHRSSESGLYGALSKINGAGVRAWTKEYGGIVGGKFQFSGITDGNPNGLIYHECWGVTATSDESQVVLACGSGIEDCLGQGSACATDPRTTWRSMLVAADSANGDVSWYRLDSYEPEDASTAGVGPSASEFAVLMDGGILSTNDEGYGFSAMVTESLAPLPPTIPAPSSPPAPSPPLDPPSQPEPDPDGEPVDEEDGGNDSDSSIGAEVIAGVVLGCAFVLAVAAIAYARRNRKKQAAGAQCLAHYTDAPV